MTMRLALRLSFPCMALQPMLEVGLIWSDTTNCCGVPWISHSSLGRDGSTLCRGPLLWLHRCAVGHNINPQLTCLKPKQGSRVLLDTCTRFDTKHPELVLSMRGTPPKVPPFPICHPTTYSDPPRARLCPVQCLMKVSVFLLVFFLPDDCGGGSGRDVIQPSFLWRYFLSMGPSIGSGKRIQILLHSDDGQQSSRLSSWRLTPCCW
ncbi:hypothetical protein BV22DRAFT_649545 [Leucogyrophana mollusca]|uniref:Uncharacterized protein n=1 Tax=Leucogyrophana mollusca TaxID=85980 RepID=A0ACB8BAF4_9AGAM|nr:hypothetical protein BV22DRAFT_649545 [Leucogyrophana mollusca]